MALSVKELPESERPYEKAMMYGINNLSNAELLSIIIKNGTISVSDARDLLNSNRKSTMELLEFLDKEKITLRKDNERILVK